MEIVKTTTSYKPTKEDVPKLIHQKASDFKCKWGVDVKGIILAPHEYMALIDIVRENPYMTVYSKDACNFGYPDQFMGMRVSLKQGAGIECEIPKEMVFQFAKGEIKF